MHVATLLHHGHKTISAQSALTSAALSEERTQQLPNMAGSFHMDPHGSFHNVEGSFHMAFRINSQSNLEEIRVELALGENLNSRNENNETGMLAQARWVDIII